MCPGAQIHSTILSQSFIHLQEPSPHSDLPVLMCFAFVHIVNCGTGLSPKCAKTKVSPKAFASRVLIFPFLGYFKKKIMLFDICASSRIPIIQDKL